jgi:hypothetical protein
MAERYQLPQSCVPPTTRRKDCGCPPFGGSEGGKTRCIKEREDMVAFQGGHPPFKGDSPYLRPQPSWAESSPTRSKVPPYGTGAGSHASCKLAQGRRSQTSARGACNRQRLQAFLHFRPDQRVKGRTAVQAACNCDKWARPFDFQRTQHGGPGPRVMQPARRLLRASNCTATRTTTTPPRLRNQYRDSRQPCVRPSSASQARRSIRQKWTGSNGGGKRAGAAVTSSAKLTSPRGTAREPSLMA